MTVRFRSPAYNNYRMKSITKEAKELLKRRYLLKSSIFSNLSNTEELNNLSEKLEIYKNGIRKAKEDKESEEHCKNILKDFLNGAFKYNCNTKGKIDLTIKYEGNIKAIIETKNYDNKTEMIKDNDYYYKSFYKSVLYYYQSRKNINKDMTVEHIIITDFENIYLFLRSDFEYLTANKQIINFFNVKKIDTNTKDFYNSSKAILEKINREVVGYKINLFEDDAEIIFKFLSPYNICSLKTNNDFNIISNTFYREIIYMMGLEETKDKKLVLNKVDNTLIKLTMDILDEDLKGEEKFETALKLNILWINRILFLKILEAQLRVFRDDNNLHILNYNEIVDYSFLYTLFFKVLAKSKERRITENKENEYYKHIPYLNSSLFEETEEEKINSITKLNNSLKMKIMSGSVLYKDRDFDKKELNFLEYILRFLNCYIFNAINDSSNINKNTIIKSSILGLVFERLNGYKDGSHFTPPAITMYMAKYSIEKSIVNKFNKFFKDANFKNIDEIKIYVDANIHKIKEQVKYILDSITIIDPACGSGHFLVACLNELIKIKSYLHVLSNDIKVDIEDDELVINYINGTEYKYNMEGGNISEIKQKIQKILFEAKKHIINNQLYGVDINPNSVNICRLRLWIELLKSSYYLENNGADKYIDLEILPNLEFKVLSANSLIELEEKEGNNNLKLAYDKTELVKNMREYFNADFETKKEIRKKVLKLLKEYSQYNTKLKDYNPFDMLKSYDFFDSEIMFGIDSFDIVIMNPPYFQLTGKHKYLHYFEKGKNKTADIYQLFMETALNKLLSQMGVVSAVVSNKWMRAGYGERTREFLYNNCYVFEIIDLGANWFESATVDTNIITYAKDREKQEKIEAYKISKCENIELNKNEKDNFIFTSEDYGAWIILNKTEKDILEKVEKFKPLKDWNINIYRGILTGFNEAFIIDEETKNKLILEDKKSKEIIKPLLRGRDIKRYSYDFKNLYLICTFPALNLNISDYPAIEKYLKSFGKRLEQSGEIGCRKKTIHKWFEMQDTIAYYKEFDKPKIIYAETTISPNFYYDNENFIAEKTNFIMTGENLKYIMAVLSSKLGFYIFYNFYSEITLGDVGFQYRKSSLEEFPIPEVDKKTEKEIINLVEKIIEGKKKGIDTRELEGEIDKIVYTLYDLTIEEINIVENI
ncbi:Eco57I restriction-modification methylase domain-containing protein [Brachyspira aalborgi]|uniref:site-specific DNA-methyltransferase (adenine-specific) n=1 Tax=Brachyspira aalborgi TaxID=29522 RepID=A0AB38PZQ0_9SPIR|nr:TaqI-like C-terminal specificity domain-containing protein [Brachyspira aalborgi]TXJ25132.1 hypothetical protein EPJ73_06590 [Brachyspira aalborgi]